MRVIIIIYLTFRKANKYYKVNVGVLEQHKEVGPCKVILFFSAFLTGFELLYFLGIDGLDCMTCYFTAILYLQALLSNYQKFTHGQFTDLFFDLDFGPESLIFYC
jgi:hypothetical protein